MVEPGQVLLVRFPQTDLQEGKLRPVLAIAAVPGGHGDLLACMLSSQLLQKVDGFDDLVDSTDEDFVDSGLKVPSVVRIGRLAVLSSSLFVGRLGCVSATRLMRIKARLSTWLAP